MRRGKRLGTSPHAGFLFLGGKPVICEKVVQMAESLWMAESCHVKIN